jgi:hypothetical protein
MVALEYAREITIRIAAPIADEPARAEKRRRKPTSSLMREW